MQAWCYQQNSLWNALYLWSNFGKTAIPSVTIDDCTEHASFSLLKLLHHKNEKKSNINVITLDKIHGIEDKFIELEKQCRSGELEKISVSFADKDIYHLNSQSLQPWWKIFFN